MLLSSRVLARKRSVQLAALVSLACLAFLLWRGKSTLQQEELDDLFRDLEIPVRQSVERAAAAARLPDNSTQGAKTWKSPAYFITLEEAFLQVDPTPSDMSWGLDKLQVLDDVPTRAGSSAPSRPFQGPVLEVEYPKGSINPHGE
jgi:hypothetical protein